MLHQRFDENMFREFSADAEARVANLADDVSVLADEPNFLFFAEAHFAEAAGDFR